MPAQFITFNVDADIARITKRAAAALQLRVEDLPDGAFRVELRTAMDAYRLGDLTASDPAWARVFLTHQ